MMNELLVGRMQAFIVYDRTAEEADIKSVAFTQIAIEPWTRKRNLFVFKLWSSGGFSAHNYKLFTEYAETFARNNKCEKVLSYVTAPQLDKMLTANGYEQTFVCYEKAL